MSCDAEMCPFWTGDGCACAVLNIDPDEKRAQIRSLQRDGYYPFDNEGEHR